MSERNLKLVIETEANLKGFTETLGAQEKLLSSAEKAYAKQPDNTGFEAMVAKRRAAIQQLTQEYNDAYSRQTAPTAAQTDVLRQVNASVKELPVASIEDVKGYAQEKAALVMVAEAKRANGEDTSQLNDRILQLSATMNGSASKTAQMVASLEYAREEMGRVKFEAAGLNAELEKGQARLGAHAAIIPKQEGKVKFLAEQVSTVPTATGADEGLGPTLPGAGSVPRPAEEPGGGFAGGAANIESVTEATRDETEAHARNVVELAKEYQARLIDLGATDAQVVKSERLVAAAENELKIIQTSASEQQTNAALIRAGADAKEVAAMASGRMLEIDQAATDATEDAAIAQDIYNRALKEVEETQAAGDPNQAIAAKKNLTEATKELTAANERLGEAQQAQIDSSGTTFEAASKGTRDYSVGLKEAHSNTRGLHQAVRLLGTQFGEFGHLAHFAMYGAVAGGLAAVAMGIKLVVEKMKEWQEHLTKLEERAREAIGATRDQVHELTLKHIAADEAYKRSKETQAILAKDTIENLKAEGAALKQLAKTSEELELARAKTDEEKTAIKSRYDAINRQIDIESKLAAMKAKQAEADQKESSRAEKAATAKAGLGTMTVEQAKERLERLKFEKSAADKIIAAPESALRQVTPVTGQPKIPEFKTVAGPGQNLGEVFFHYERNPEFDRLQQEVKSAKEFKLELLAEGLRLTKATTAGDEARALAKEIFELEGEIKRSGIEIESAKKSAAGQRKVAALTEQFPKQKEVLDAGVAAMQAQQDRAKFIKSSAGQSELGREAEALAARAAGRKLSPQQEVAEKTAIERQSKMVEERKAVEELNRLLGELVGSKLPGMVAGIRALLALPVTDPRRIKGLQSVTEAVQQDIEKAKLPETGTGPRLAIGQPTQTATPSPLPSTGTLSLGETKTAFAPQPQPLASLPASQKLPIPPPIDVSEAVKALTGIVGNFEMLTGSILRADTRINQLASRLDKMVAN